MKYVLCIALALSITGCTTRNSAGACQGFADSKEPGHEYAVSQWNVFVGLLFSETVLVPVVVAAKYLECPVEAK